MISSNNNTSTSISSSNNNNSSKNENTILTNDMKYKQGLRGSWDDQKFDSILASYCIRIKDDSSLHPFFGQQNLDDLKDQQQEFFLAAFLQQVDPDIALKFCQWIHLSGLEEEHFNTMLEHFNNALVDSSIEQQVFDTCKLYLQQTKNNCTGDIISTSNDTNTDTNPTKGITPSPPSTAPSSPSIAAATTTTTTTPKRNVMSTDESTPMNCSSETTTSTVNGGKRYSHADCPMCTVRPLPPVSSRSTSLLPTRTNSIDRKSTKGGRLLSIFRRSNQTNK